MSGKKPAVIHQTDLFHPHADPDDHWDLACQFALAMGGDIDLKGVLIDYPVVPTYGDPSVQSVNQLNYITGLAVPVGVGLPQKVGCEANIDAMLEDGRGMSGVNMVLNTLEQSDEPVSIHIVGSSRDIAVAFRRAPELFRDKCKALYLNAGASDPESPLEYNVTIDPFTYSLMFKLPCPVYWMPCMDVAILPYHVGEYGTFYEFTQRDILPSLSESMQKFFLYALSKSSDSKWLSYLRAPVNTRLLEHFSDLPRAMWSTGGFLHAAGKTVLRSGEIACIGDRPEEEVFRLEPIEIACGGDGRTSWKLGGGETNRNIFHVLDTDAYQKAMITAMRDLLLRLP